VSFDLQTILIFSLLALPYNALLPSRWRGWALLVMSVVAVYWLQPALPIRFSDYILPTLTVLLTLACWWLTRAPDQSATRQDWITLVVVLALVIGLSFMRFVDSPYRLTPSRPPEPLAVMVGVGLAGVVVGGLSVGTRYIASLQRFAINLMLLVIIGLFVLIKTEPLAIGFSGWWRGQTGQDVSLAGLIDLNWLGFSYVAFRLIHTLRDRQTGLLPPLSLREYATYVVFFPSYTAGPIDRAERFVTDFRTLPEKIGLSAPRFLEGGTRIMVGLLKKFVIADSLAGGLALNPINAAQSDSTLGLWLLVYGYALRLFFDFSGYTDIAIGIGILFGVKLPENFDRPYLKTNITTFWQSWHITLSNWARFYVFSPLSRSLLSRKPKPSPMLIVFLTQMATMLVIGLWHGVTLNFVIWGVWHGAALFVHKIWSDRTRPWYRGLNDKPGQKRAWTLFAWFITFHYVVIGWVWFALPDTIQAMRVIGQLFGVR
jgi:alginate O-acetyltransferase complex protein AlgI